MRLRHIEIFEAIRQAGSLTQAAALLHISQPAASKILAHAEAQLGFKLFERVKGRLYPTREATILAPQIARLGQDLSSVRRLAANLRHGRQGHLRIGCAPALGLGLLPRTLRDFQQRAQNATFSISTLHSAELVNGLRTRELDIIVTFDTNDYPGVTRKQIGHTELVHLSRDTLSGPVELAQLADRPLIVLDARDHTGALLEAAFNAADIELNAQIAVQTHYVACSLAEAGCGDAIIDMLTGCAMVRPGMTLNRLRPTIQVPISIMTHATDPQSVLHNDFAEHITEVCHDLEAAPLPGEQESGNAKM